MGRDEQGQALVEFALVIVLFLALLSGLVDLARISATYVVMTNAVREGARAGALGGDDREILDALRRAGSFLEETRLEVLISPDQAARERGLPLKVQLSYSVDLLMPFTSALLPNPFPLEAVTVMRME
jgi:Flp pilus assembly protein TadG